VVQCSPRSITKLVFVRLRRLVTSLHAPMAAIKALFKTRLQRGAIHVRSLTQGFLQRDSFRFAVRLAGDLTSPSNVLSRHVGCRIPSPSPAIAGIPPLGCHGVFNSVTILMFCVFKSKENDYRNVDGTNGR